MTETRHVRHVVLLGLMGAGKTTVGRSLAQRLGWEFNDSDERIGLATGKTVRELKADIGVDAMHRLEAEHLFTALAEDEPSVVCAAASVVEDARCREAVSHPEVATVWLKASPDTLARRFLSSGHRPAYGDDPGTFLSEQSAARSPLFAALSQVVVDVDNRTVDDVTDSVWFSLRQKGL